LYVFVYNNWIHWITECPVSGTQTTLPEGSLPEGLLYRNRWGAGGCERERQFSVERLANGFQPDGMAIEGQQDQFRSGKLRKGEEVAEDAFFQALMTDVQVAGVGQMADALAAAVCVDLGMGMENGNGECRQKDCQKQDAKNLSFNRFHFCVIRMSVQK